MSPRRTTIRPLHRTLRLAAAMASFLALGLLGPAGAEAASCGRHVAPSSGSLALVDGLLGVAVGTAEFGPTPARPQAPCSGPRCSEGRRRESPTPSPAHPISLREWGNLATHPVLPPPAVSGIPGAGPTLRPLAISSRPERPPRPFA